MKGFLLLLLIITFASCDNSKEVKNISTVDSNTGSPVDSNDALLYLDNPQSDSFTIAVDSGSNQKQDTTYRQ